MQTRIFFKESRRFLKENKKRIMLFTILGAVIFALFILVNLMKNNDSSSLENARTEEISDMAEFSIYIEKKDWIPFNNNALLEKVLFSEKPVKKVEQETGIKFANLLELQKEEEFIPTGEDRGVIGVLRDVTNEAMVFQVKIGTEKDNMEVANYYFDMIMNNEVDILKDKKIYVLNAPEIKELTQQDLAFVEENNNEISPLVLIIQLFVSLFAGFILGVLVSIFYHIFNKKISYAFNYNIDEKDIFLIERESQDKFIYDIINPKNEDKIIVVENSLPSKVLNKLSSPDQKVITTTNLIEIDPKIEMAEIVFVIVENNTTKFWYNSQREYLKRFDSKIKIVQVPNSILEENK